jgi:acyl-CoA synthetase (AMP-forming)/AMP-acid ligase II
VKIYDDDGNEVEPGDTGRIFVGNDLQFEGYTGGGGNKDVIDGLMSSGDVGHFDDEGRLFIDGRDDDMIVSGGENVFPQEVEDLLSGHESISEAAVFGIDDEEFGQRLKAVVVTKGSKQLSEDDVKKFVKSNLAGYKVPKEVEFIDELPRTSTGKVLKRELKDDGDGDGDDGGENGKSDGKKGSGESAEEASGGGKKKPAEKG